jgi:hypothetical protein
MSFSEVFRIRLPNRIPRYETPQTLNGIIGKLILASLSAQSYSKTLMNTFYFPPGSLKQCRANIITVVQDSMGMDQTEDGE